MALVVWLIDPAEAWLLAAVAAVTVIGIWAAGREEAYLRQHDPQCLVVDEAAGMLVALVGHSRGLLWVLALFLLFRVMDIWKPFPIRQLQSLPGGFGVVVDDLLAGLYANLLLQVRHLF